MSQVTRTYTITFEYEKSRKNPATGLTGGVEALKGVSEAVEVLEAARGRHQVRLRPAVHLRHAHAPSAHRVATLSEHMPREHNTDL